MTPHEALERIAFLMERELAPTYKVRAFRNAARAIRALTADDLQQRTRTGRLQDIAGVGKSTAKVITEALNGEIPYYLAELETHEAPALAGENDLYRALRGDCHTHSDWSDGGSDIWTMATTARDLGHEYIVLTDHSPRLTVANGLSPERLEQQLDELKKYNERFANEHADTGAPAFRILSGIEVDILDDGGLDQEMELLGRLDIVVASVHSHLRAPSEEMTPRMLAAIANPRTNVLGHCTGRLVTGRGRPPSQFDSKQVFAACAEHDVAVEINSRLERKDPPKTLLREAVGAGCSFSIDTDAHAPGQLAWQPVGCERAQECGVDADRVVNTKSADDLIAWAQAKRSP